MRGPRSNVADTGSSDEPRLSRLARVALRITLASVLGSV
ncbi:hypothetical protein EDD33_1993 [Nocardioides aurantiacus]|uniref:Uncharacterized protein n=1 Tax=Nocardioides aurantiacus TaxID=86796 RepID=A0A3N2CUC1_9ACTN|nr:hypothetical protein EDD33_1993 [Nocardioides aurantiacus]